METKKTNNLAVCIICGFLTAFGIATSIISLTQGSNGIWVASDVIAIILSVAICYYAFWGYKKPHGNLLKYIILLRAASYLIILYQVTKNQSTYRAVASAIIIGLLCYIAGRLHKVKQNIVLLIIATLFLALDSVLGVIDANITIGFWVKITLWVDICAAYFLRYKEHKDAGKTPYV